MSECARCDGCGRVADSEHEEPWTAWMSLPLRSSLAVLTGMVRPKPCPECGGTGEEP